MTGTVTGSVTGSYSSNTDQNGNTTFSFVNASANLSVDLPVIPAVATTAAGSHFWSSPLTWGNTGIVLVDHDAVTVVDQIAGVLSGDVFSVLNIPDTAQTLVNSGPTEGTIGFPDWSVSGLGGTASLNASANLRYDVLIPTGAQIIMDQPTVVVQSLTIESGSNLTGNGGFTVRTDLFNEGTLYNLGGTIQGNFSNASVGPQVAYTDVTNATTIQGNFSNTGTMDIESGASLNLSQPSNNNGILNLYGGSLSAPDTFTNNGTFSWHGGSIPSSFQNGITGLLSINSSADKFIQAYGILTNSGTITQIGGASTNLTFNGWRGGDSGPQPATLNNLTGGVYDIQCDGGLIANSGAFPNSVNNAGLFKKSAGTGTSVIGQNVTFNNNGGSVEVDSGTLSFQGGASSSNGSFLLTSAGVIQLASQLTLNGPNTISGNGTFEVASSGTLAAPFSGNGSLTANAGVTVLVDGGSLSSPGGVSPGSNLTLGGSGAFLWTSGSIFGGGYNPPNLYGTVTNTSPNFTISGSDGKYIQAYGTLANSGTITQVGDASTNLTFNGWRGGDSGPQPATLNNLIGGIYDIQGDGGLIANTGAFPNSVSNSGTFKKSAGSGTSVIGQNVPFNNNDGTVEVDSGTLSFQGGVSSVSGAFVVNNSSAIQIASQLTLAGVNTAAGSGTIEIPSSGALAAPMSGNGSLVASSGIAILIDGGSLSSPGGASPGSNLTLSGSGAFYWSSGSIFGGGYNPPNVYGTVTNTSPNFIISGSDGKYIQAYATLANSGTITQVGDASTNLTFNGWRGGDSGPQPATFNNLIGGVYDIECDGGLIANTGAFPNSVNNAGLFEKSGGSGTSIIGPNVPFNNNGGAVQVSSGTISFQGGLSSSNGSFALANGSKIYVGSQFTVSGINSVSGNGTMEVPAEGGLSVPFGGTGSLDIGTGVTLMIDGGTLSAPNGNAPGPNLTLSGAGSIQWTSGSISGGGYDPPYTYGTVTNTSPNFIISGPGDKYIQAYGTLANSGTITQIGGASTNLTFNGWRGGDSGPQPATLNNLTGGVYDIQCDGGLIANSGAFPNSVNNAGLFKKSAGTGTSVIGQNVTFNNTGGTVEVDSGMLEFDGGFTQTDGITAMEGGNLSGSLNLEGGLLKGSGTIYGAVYNTGATVSPGNSPGTISVVGDYHQNSAGILSIEMAGGSVGEYDLLNVEGTAYLDGTLDISLLDGFRPTLGETFQVLDFNNINGRFATVDVLNDPAYQFGLTYNGNNLSLTTTAVPEPGTLGLIAVTCLLGLRRRHRASHGLEID